MADRHACTDPNGSLRPLRRVLIVSPRFVPSNAADMHRVRQALPYLREFGWEPTVLAVTPDEVEAPQDPMLLRTIPDDVEVVRTRAAPIRFTRAVGVGSLEARSLLFLGAAGRGLIQKTPFDLVFFSTTAMATTVLGPRWKRKFGLPFVVDLQDPWYSRYYDEHNVTPPGGRLKFTLMNALARQLEPYVLRGAARIVSVSSAYPTALAERYPWFATSRASVIPFGASEADFTMLRQLPAENRLFDPNDGKQHWVYAGAAGPIMEQALRALFLALREYRAREPRAANNLRLHFIGTDYAPAGQACKSVEPLAAAYGVDDLVDEQPQRVPYFEALQCLLHADALLMPGSNNAGYTASKLYPYILADKPLLALFHRSSSVVDVMQDTRAGTVVAFDETESPAAIAARVGDAWFGQEAWLRPPDTDWQAFEPYTAREMTRRLVDVFEGAAPSKAGMP